MFCEWGHSRMYSFDLCIYRKSFCEFGPRSLSVHYCHSQSGLLVHWISHFFTNSFPACILATNSPLCGGPSGVLYYLATLKTNIDWSITFDRSFICLFLNSTVLSDCPLFLHVRDGHAHGYLTDMVLPVLHLPGSTHLQSVQRCHFDVPRSWTVYGSRSFSVAAPQAWNELPADIRQINTFFTFKRHLKMFHWFIDLFIHPCIPCRYINWLHIEWSLIPLVH